MNSHLLTLINCHPHWTISLSLYFSMRKTLPGKELNVVREKLKQKEEFANKISESLSAMEQENSELQDRYGR